MRTYTEAEAEVFLNEVCWTEAKKSVFKLLLPHEPGPTISALPSHRAWMDGEYQRSTKLMAEATAPFLEITKTAKEKGVRITRLLIVDEETLFQDDPSHIGWTLENMGRVFGRNERPAVIAGGSVKRLGLLRPECEITNYDSKYAIRTYYDEKHEIASREICEDSTSSPDSWFMRANRRVEAAYRNVSGEFYELPNHLDPSTLVIDSVRAEFERRYG